jgi:hypothetical protein
MRKRALAVFLLSVLSLVAAASLEVKEGLVKIVVDETTARVSLYQLIDIPKGLYEPLLFAKDPRTSFASLSIDGVQYRLGDASDYRFSVSRTDSGALIEFHSKACVVRENLDFMKSEGAALADGIKISYSLENVSQKDENIGLRLLLDTYLAEKSGIHFRTDTKARISSETSLDALSGDSWISTPGDRADFMVLLKGPGIDKPDRVLLSNWKRLSDESWGFDAIASRNFTLLPYSVNDSALALYWQPGLVKRGDARHIAVILGAFNPKGYPLQSAGTDATAALFASTVLSSDPNVEPAAAMSSDLVAVRDLLSRIDLSLSSGKAPSPEELATWQKILDRLEERKKGY